MRVLYIDIDSLRADHLGCYGYHRATSPAIDRVAAEGVRFERVYTSDAPCGPSRAALFSGRFGIHTGVITHGTPAGRPRPELLDSTNPQSLAQSDWMAQLRTLGYRAATVSPFGHRHGADYWLAGFHDVHDPGRRGREIADEINAPALRWIEAHGREANWFLHVNYWDPHRPYRTPMSFGEPFARDPLPDWLNESVRRCHWNMAGPNSAQELIGFDGPDACVDAVSGPCPRQPGRCDSMAAMRQVIDGYDVGIRYVDHAVATLLEALERCGVLEETAIIIGADHGENFGELGVYGDHSTADEPTLRVPLIVRWPGVTVPGGADEALRCHIDLAATVTALLGGEVPDHWDATSFADALRRPQEREAGRPWLVGGQALWTCQRAARWDRYLYIRTDHDGYHEYPRHMLFDVERDPHEQRDLAAEAPELARHGEAIVDGWLDAMTGGDASRDPMGAVLEAGGPTLVRGRLEGYLARLRVTGRGEAAARLAERGVPWHIPRG